MSTNTTAINIAGYETTIIARPDITVEAQKALIDKYKAIIEAHGGTIVLLEDWGRRKLTYPIKNETRGNYIYMVYTGNSSLVTELERNIRINETIIRFLSVQLGDDFDATKFKRAITPVNKREPQPEFH